MRAVSSEYNGLRNSYVRKADSRETDAGGVYIATQERRWNRTRIVDPYTILIGPGYCDTKASMVSSVIPSTVACATKILSKGSL